MLGEAPRVFRSFKLARVAISFPQVDEAAQAVAQWSAMRSANASPASHASSQHYGQPAQLPQAQRSRLHEPSLRADDASLLRAFGTQCRCARPRNI